MRDLCLASDFAETKLTSCVGLELLDRYLRGIGFSNLICRVFGTARLGGISG
jgi:hypothetical protein